MFHEGIEWAGERSLVPTYVVSLAGCNLGCAFCLTGASSQRAQAGVPLDVEGFARRVRGAAPRLRSVTILGGEPSIHLPDALLLAAEAPAELPLVWKTNAFASRTARAVLDGVVEVVLADFKFGNDGCARRLAGVADYVGPVADNLAWARDHARLIVRHLLMPGHLDCCTVPVLDHLARRLPGIPLSLMTGYLPAFRAGEHPGLGRCNRADEVELARAAAADFGIRIEPWVVVAEDAPAPGDTHDELWIDGDGRLLVDSASAALARCLHDLGGAR